jgi:hypothetical protein
MADNYLYREPGSGTTFGSKQLSNVHYQQVIEMDPIGFMAGFTPINDARVAQPYRLVGTTFGASNDTNFWTLSNSGAASAATVATGYAALTSGTANGGYGQITSVRAGRFMFVHPHLFRAAVRLTATTAADCTRRWGAFTVSGQTPQNGFYFSVDGAGALSVNHANAGSVTTISSGSFNGRATTYTLDTNVHAYEIYFFEMGAWFAIDGVLIHRFTPTTAKLCADFTVPITATAINAGTTSGTLHVWAASILRLGRDLTAPRFARITTAATATLKSGAGTLHRITLNDPRGTLITIYDNTAGSGTVIGVINAPATANPLTLHYGVDFQTGLTIVSTGTWDATVIYE